MTPVLDTFLRDQHLLRVCVFNLFCCSTGSRDAIPVMRECGHHGRVNSCKSKQYGHCYPHYWLYSSLTKWLLNKV